MSDLINSLLYLGTMLIPINGIIWIGLRNERKRNRTILLQLWRRGYRRGSK